MERSTRSNLKITYFLLCGFVLSAIVGVYHNSEKFLSNHLSYDYKFRKSESKWHFESEVLDPGIYYISLGRPRGNCALVVDKKIVDSGLNSNSGYRRSFSLDGSVRLETKRSLKGSIECEKSEGFASGLSHQLLITGYKTGAFLHSWRLINILVLGPVTSLVLLIFSLYFFTTSLKKRNASQENYNYFLSSIDFTIMAVISLLYSLSLSHFSRIVVSDYSATVLHIFLRISFSLAFLNLATKHVGFRKTNITLHSSLIGFFLYVGLYYPSNLEAWYDTLLPFFFISTLITFILMLSIEPKSKEIIYLKLIFACWAISQVFDVFSVYTGIGVFSAPTIIAVTSFFLCLITYSRFKVLENVNLLSKNIAEALNRDIPFQKLLAEASFYILNATGFNRVSCYVDSFITGESLDKGKKLIRIYEFGYSFDTSDLETLVLDDSQGERMISVDSSVEELKINQNNIDGSWYSTLRLGESLYINLSTDHEVGISNIVEGKQVVDESMPVLKRLGEFVESSKDVKSGLDVLRFHYPQGITKEHLVFLFADINNFSQMSKLPGFSEFLNTVYFPALFRAVNGTFFGEIREGDDLFLFSKMESNADFENKIIVFLDFVENEGRLICEKNLFKPITFKITVGHSDSDIGITEKNVNITSEGINMAARITGTATKGRISVLSDMVSNMQLDNFESIGPIDVVKKNNYLKMNYLIRKAS